MPWILQLALVISHAGSLGCIRQGVELGVKGVASPLGKLVQEWEMACSGVWRDQKMTGAALFGSAIFGPAGIFCWARSCA